MLTRLGGAVWSKGRGGRGDTTGEWRRAIVTHSLARVTVHSAGPCRPPCPCALNSPNQPLSFLKRDISINHHHHGHHNNPPTAGTGWRTRARPCRTSPTPTSRTRGTSPRSRLGTLGCATEKWSGWDVHHVCMYVCVCLYVCVCVCVCVCKANCSCCNVWKTKYRGDEDAGSICSFVSLAWPAWQTSAQRLEASSRVRWLLLSRALDNRAR